MTNIPQRPYRDDVSLSIIGLGGMVLVGMEQKDADALVLGAVDKGINYFDVAPFYGDTEAEQKLGAALQPHRHKVFLADKTLERSARGAEAELEQSLRFLRTDHFDLYQFHAVTTVDEVEEIFAPGGAAEAFHRAQRQGKIRYVGFSAHAAPAALSMMDHLAFDSILFPVNYVCYAQGNFGPQIMDRAKQLGVARIALKALAQSPWRKGEKHRHPKCWYRPIDDRDLARQALRFTLSEDVTAALPPGDSRLFQMALELASDLTPMTAEERAELLTRAKGIRPLMRA